ncbi:MAG: hypothetical protein ACP5XB_16390, partial [Isosphaeraceae bacterium]
MFRISRGRLGVLTRKLQRVALLALMGLGSLSGCSREFYREWANQDASEAVFEKSRDPRWRLDAFSIEPPAMSRFADPYDPEFLPAPPDDPTTEMLSPVPQWPDNRLLVPAESTAYLDMMEGWMRERDQARREGKLNTEMYAEPGNGGRAGTPQPRIEPQPPRTGSPFAPGAGTPAPPPSGASGAGSQPPARITPPIPAPAPPPGGGPSARLSPRRPSTNSETDPQASTRLLLADARLGQRKSKVPPPRPASSFRRPLGLKDQSVQRAVRQVVPSPSSAPAQGSQGTPERPGTYQVPMRPAIPMEPNPNQEEMSEETRRELERIAPRRPAGAPLSPEQAAELSSVLIPKIPPFNVAAAAGLPRNADPYVVTLQQAFTLALINARVYQLQLETLYNAALAVTLQRFAFEPQFYAGVHPTTSPLGIGFPGINPTTQFLYQTRQAQGGQVSTLQTGTIAGVGKAFSTGGQLLMGFANQVVFNFVGKNPIQPTVASSLPLSFVQPFLRGAGRAVVLEPLTQAERQLLYQVRTFAKFRQEFTVDMLTGGQILQPGIGFNLLGFSMGGNNDPTLGFIPNSQQFAEVLIDLKNLAYFEQLAALYEQLIEGESSGLSQLQVDQV